MLSSTHNIAGLGASVCAPRAHAVSPAASRSAVPYVGMPWQDVNAIAERRIDGTFVSTGHKLGTQRLEEYSP